MKIQFSPVADGTRWQVLLTKEVTTLHCLTIDHADLQYEHDPDDLTGLREAIEARALEIFTRGDATVIGTDRPPVQVTSWEAMGSALARQALAHHLQRYGDDATAALGQPRETN